MTELQNYQSNPSIRNAHLNPLEGVELASDLSTILGSYATQRVIVLGPPASGKSTLLQHIEGTDMDVVFDTMPLDLRRHILHHEYPFMYLDGDRKTIKYTEREYIPGDPDSEQFLRHTGKLLQQYTNKNLEVKPGVPVFGTSLIDSDVIVHLKLSDQALHSRIESRNAKTHRQVQRHRVFALRDILAEEVQQAHDEGIHVEELLIGA